MFPKEITEEQKEFFAHLKKGSLVYSKHLGTPVRCELLESIKQGKGFKRTVLCCVFGEEIGMFTECGSIYTSDIILNNLLWTPTYLCDVPTSQRGF